MRKTFVLALALLLALAALPACGSDDGGGGSTTTDTTTGGSDSTGGSDATGGSDTTAGDTGGDTAGLPGGVSECQNTEDKTWLTTDQDGGKKGRDLASSAAGDCGKGCLNSPDPKACTIKCMKDDKGVKLSDACAGCYGDIVLCTIEKCVVKCIADSSAKICTDCQKEQGCTDAFYKCTGPLD